MEHIIYLNDNNTNIVNDRNQRRQDRRRNRKFRIITFRSSRTSRPECFRVPVRDRVSRDTVQERVCTDEIVGARKRVNHWRERGHRALLLIKRTTKRNAPIICQLVMSYIICLILTAIFLRYLFVF